MAAASSQEELHQQLPGGVGTSQEALPQQAPVAVDYSKYRPLYRAILAANWEDALIFFNQDPAAIQSPLNCGLGTALHVAAKVGNASFMEKLVALLLLGDINEEVVEALSPRNRIGNTPLHIAAWHGNIEVADILVRRNSNLLYLHNNYDWFPIHSAAMNSRKSKDAFLYFLSHTRDDEYGQPNPYAGPTGVSILVNLIHHKFYDLALLLARRYPDLGRHNRLGVSKAESTTSAPIFHLITSLLQWLVGKSIVNKMVLHHQAVKLLKCLCDQLKTLNDTQVTSLTIRAVFEATSLDIWQVILNTADAYPDSVYFSNSMRQRILHVAVINRSENVFKLVCGTNVLGNILSSLMDVNSNSVLHLAGKLAPPHKLNLVSGAALQMQRELQWFKEVKKIVPPDYSSYLNKDGKTPSMVFTEEHKELKEAGEKWMKDTANSCTIAAALIVTVVFAAAITVPGGNSGENGLPIFSNHNAFTIFAFSNAASLFTSTTSLLVFLSILTSRFAEQDFLYALPKRLIIGLLTLFLSIIFMMIAFSSTVYLVFGNNRRGVLIMVAGFACLPVTSFVLLQFPLLVALVSSTYGRGIFNSRGFPQLPY
ncbi:ankyrin repeat-containing protein NPR4-like isoform X2 [Ipomoea triloba]|uniref:ankyrin repeat-containing protein NPR4-like isoform X2 n=1 Tax=Ipomoea triloba TaxID=35885 RepID=UPI00125D5859|nr:ankyrin repeat-containing protein NPR4-like isoform X2 [Ipomoea triloba]